MLATPASPDEIGTEAKRKGRRPDEIGTEAKRKGRRRDE